MILRYDPSVLEKAEKLKDEMISIQDFERASVLRDIHNLAKKAVAKLEKKKLARAK